MSSLKEKLGMFGESLKAIATNAIQGEELVVSPAIADIRKSVCEGCPKLKNLGAMRQCTECGCVLNLKWKLADQKCPLGLWKE